MEKQRLTGHLMMKMFGDHTQTQRRRARVSTCGQPCYDLFSFKSNPGDAAASPSRPKPVREKPLSEAAGQ